MSVTSTAEKINAVRESTRKYYRIRGELPMRGLAKVLRLKRNAFGARYLRALNVDFLEFSAIAPGHAAIAVVHCRLGKISMVVVGNYRTHAELRKKPRRQFHYNTRIVIDQKTPPINCAITDISETGARLILEAKAEVPDTFTLLLTANGEARRYCRVVWREGTDIGVEFPNGHS